MLLDNVRYHRTKGVMELLASLKNITFKYLPPYSSELNSIEHLWKDIRSCVTHNYFFETITEVAQAIHKYFMEVQRLPAKVKRLCAYIL